MKKVMLFAVLAASASNSVADAVKTQIQQKIDASTAQVNNEIQAWKDVLKN